MKREKTKIAISSNIVNVQEAIKLLENNIFPLAVALTNGDDELISILNSLNNTNSLYSKLAQYYDYKHDSSIDNKYNIIYMYLDLDKVQREFYEKKIDIDRFISHYDVTKYVYGFIPSTNQEENQQIVVLNKRKRFVNQKDLNFVILPILAKANVYKHLHSISIKKGLMQEAGMFDWNTSGLCDGTNEDDEMKLTKKK